MKKRNGALMFITAFVFSGIVFVLDLGASDGFAVGFLYLFPLLVFLRPGKGSLFVIAPAALSLLTAVAAFLNPGPAPAGVAVFNSVLAVAALWAVSLTAWRRLVRESASRASGEKYRLMFSRMLNAFALHKVVLDGQGRPVDFIFVEVNDAFETMTGLKRENLIGKKATEALPGIENDPADWIGIYGRVALTGEEKTFESYSRPLERWYSVSAFSPEKGYFCTIFLDVTGQRKANEAEAALREREYLYRSLFENMLNGFAYCRMLFDGGRPQDFIYLDVNKAFEAQTGLKNVAGKKVSEVIPGIRESDPGLLERYGRVALTGKPEVFETFVEALGMWFSISVYSPQREYFVAVFDVISERKRVEKELKDQYLTLAGIIESTSSAVFSVDRGYRYTSFNRTHAAAMKTLHGVDIEIGKSMLEYQTAGADRDKTKAHLDRALKGERFVETEQAGETGYLRLYFEVMHHPIKNPDGRIIGVAVFAQDVSERRRLEESLAQSRKMDAIGRLAGGVAHDFNNLLTSILGFAQILSEKLEATEYARDLLEISNAAQRARQLTGQLLAFSRKQILQPQVIKINSLLAEMEQMLRRILREDIEFVSVLHPEAGPVKVDPTHLHQVIMNLVVNARDAMPGGGKLTLETMNVALDREYELKHPETVAGSYVMIAVSDTGVGMDTATKSRLFEPFFTTKGDKGTGLGLATTYGIVKQSKGSIEVYSEPGHGTTFKIYLPRVDENCEDITTDRIHSGNVRGSETILVVEDEEGVRRIIRRILESNGYMVVEAANVEAAKEVVSGYGKSIDLVITDIVMPGKRSGPAIVEHVTRLHPRVKSLYMSGYTENAIVHHGVLDPGVNFIAKPFNNDELLRKVRETLDEPADKEGR